MNSEKHKTKPKKIVIYERNENNELIREIVEKKRKRKITALKKAIMKKRDLIQLRKDKEKKKDSEKNPEDQMNNIEEGESSGYETIVERNPESSSNG